MLHKHINNIFNIGYPNTMDQLAESVLLHCNLPHSAFLRVLEDLDTLIKLRYEQDIEV